MAIETENMADVRTFRAATMNEALDRVRQEMGGEAVILHTRQISQRRFLPWRKREEEVEITAGLGVNIRPAVTRTPTSSRKPVNAAAQAVQSMAAAGPTDELQLRSAPATRTPLAAHSTIAPPQPPNRTPQISSSRFNPEGNTAGLSEQLVATGAAVAAQAALAAPIHPTHNDRTAEFSKKLDAIQKTLEQLGRVSRTSRADEIPTELFHVYTELIDSEVDEDLARELVFRLKEQATPGQLSDTATAKTLLTSMVESEIRCSNPIVPHPGKRKVVALVGATGVGKTTTIAKLAANFRLRDGVKMGLVTVDTYRIAAVEQLRTYAEIIDLPMKVVTSPPEMRRALAELEGLDLVLIDTAGRSPRDDLQIQELNNLEELILLGEVIELILVQHLNLY